MHACVATSDTKQATLTSHWWEPVLLPGFGCDVFLQKFLAIEQSEKCMREQMQALQRKLVRVVTENEALKHVVDKLQCYVLGVRRQLQHAGMAPEVELDESLLRPSPHQVSRSAGPAAPPQRPCTAGKAWEDWCVDMYSRRSVGIPHK